MLDVSVAGPIAFRLIVRPNFRSASVRDTAGLFRSHRTEEIPPIPFEIKENRNLSIRLDTRDRDELDARRDYPFIGSLEIIDSQEEADAAGELLPHDPGLLLAVGTCEEDAGQCISFHATPLREHGGGRLRRRGPTSFDGNFKPVFNVAGRGDYVLVAARAR